MDDVVDIVVGWGKPHDVTGGKNAGVVVVTSGVDGGIPMPPNPEGKKTLLPIPEDP